MCVCVCMCVSYHSYTQLSRLGLTTTNPTHLELISSIWYDSLIRIVYGCHLQIHKFMRLSACVLYPILYVSRYILYSCINKSLLVNVIYIYIYIYINEVFKVLHGTMVNNYKRQLLALLHMYVWLSESRCFYFKIYSQYLIE